MSGPTGPADSPAVERGAVVEQSRPLIALAYMMGATLSFTLMAVAGRELSSQLDTFEIMTYRSAIGLAIVSAIAVLRRRTALIRAQRMRLHLARNLSHFLGQNLWLYAVAVIPFSQLFAFEFSVPLWVALLAPFFLNERLTATRVIAASVGFVGILLVARPDMTRVDPGVVAALLAAFTFTAVSITTKLLTRTEATISIMFWLTLMQLGFGLLTAGYDLDIRLPSPANLHWVLIVGVCGLTAHFCITSALSHAPATVVTPLDFARLPIVAVVGMLFYDEPLLITVLIGAVVIFAANFMNVRAETRAGVIPAGGRGRRV